MSSVIVSSTAPAANASPTRRAFLRQTALATLGAVTTACNPATASQKDSVSSLSSSSSSWTKHGIVLAPTEPWEGDNIQNFTCCAEPLSSDEWRLWYSVSNGPNDYTIAIARGGPGGQWIKTAASLTSGPPVESPLSIGNLPDGWKIVQPVHIQLPNGRHRLYFWAHARDICRYLAAESVDGRLYSVIDPLRPVLYHPKDRAACGVECPSGFVLRSGKVSRPAEEPAAIPKLLTNDATNVYLLPDGTFEAYSAALMKVPKSDPAYVPEDNAPGLLRVIDRLTSVDGLHFENRERVIERDASDPVDQQFYYLAVTHTARGRLGMLGHYRCRAQTMDLECCFSKNGTNWERPRRTPWISRGESPSPDCFGIYAGSQLVYHRDLWHLFYTGTNSTHNGRNSCGRPRQVIMLATTSTL